MKIGTPLSSSATRVMLLGSGELGKEVIISLQRLGVEVIAVDRYENAPGHQLAHRSHVIDMTDGKALKALVKTEKPHIIVPEIEAIDTDMLAESQNNPAKFYSVFICNFMSLSFSSASAPLCAVI